MVAILPPVVLLHMNGDNASTDIVDVANHAWTANGDAKLTTADSKFGGACLTLDGSGDFITTSGGPAYLFGTGEFTIEAWVKPTNTGREMALVDFYNSTPNSWQMAVSSSGRLSFYGDNAYLILGTSSLYGAWHHVAISRKSGVLYGFVDGVVEGSVANIADFSSTASFLGIGGQVSSRNPAYDYAGLVDEVRVTKGVGRYSSAFTLPSAPFPDDLAPFILTGDFTADVGAVPAQSFTGTSPIFVGRLYRNFFILGAEAKLVGTVKEKNTPDNTPLRRRVRLVRERDGATVGETWSEASTGNYAFTNIDSAEAYSVISYDHEHNYRAIVADNLSIDNGGVELIA